MRYPRYNSDNRAVQTMISFICAALAWLHRRLGWSARMVGRGLAATIRPIPWSIRYAVGAAALALPMIYLSAYRLDPLIHLGQLGEQHLKIWRDTGLAASFDQLCLVAGAVGVLCLAAVALSPWRHRHTLLAFKICGAGYLVVWFYLLVFLYRAPNLLMETDAKIFPNFERIGLVVRAFLYWVPGALLGLLYIVPLLTRPIHRFYAGQEPDRKLLGDRIVEDLQTHGGDPRFRTSSYWSAALHIIVLFVIPLLVFFRGCEAPYGIIKGSGDPVVQVIKVKPVKKKQEEQFVLNMNSPILFYRPKIEDSEVLEKMLEETEMTYVAQNLESGKLGKGGGKKGGWPLGMEGAKVRFIRLEYEGGDWDQSMGAGADMNLLIQFNKMTGFDIAMNTESRPVGQLRRFPKKKAPPFVFITGMGNINMTANEIRTLRWYCLEEGGMIFADNGGGRFDSSFRNLMKRVFPEKQWIDIANDDIIYRQPFLFPNGAPPLWHHSGKRALGIKHEGRWVVFYHQGDLNDAWKTGHSGVTPQTAQAAYMMGVNVINYAFNRYYERHYE